MLGIDRNTGAAVDDWLQFVQRATRALTTPWALGRNARYMAR